MDKKQIDFELPDNMNEENLEKLLAMMESYNVEIPDEYEIDKTIENLRQYVPSKRRIRQGICNRFIFLMMRVMEEVTFISKTYWGASLILFIIGYLVTIKSPGTNPYYTVMALGPIPFIFGMIEVFRGREEGMTEIEMSCRISPGEIMLSRIFLITIYDVLLNTVLSLALSQSSPGMALNYWTMTLCWFVPLTLISGLSMWTAMKVRGGYASIISASAWGIAAFYLISHEKLMEKVMVLDSAAYLLIIACGIGISLVQIKRIVNKYLTFEGSVLIEINN